MKVNEDAMVSADIAPSSALNIPKGGRVEKAFYKYRKLQGKRIIKRPTPKFKDLMKAY